MSTTLLRPATTRLAILGGVLRYWREKSGLEQRDVAEAVGVGQPYWSKVELGRGNLSVAQLVRACEKLGISPSDALADTERARKDLGKRGVVVVDAEAQDDYEPGLAAVSGAALKNLLLAALNKKSR